MPNVASNPMERRYDLSDRLIFRKATPDDDPSIMELLKSSFRRELPLDWWRWFSYQCPTGLNRTSVIEDPEAGTLAGSDSFLPIRLYLNGREIKASLETNASTHPDYRGRGLYTRVHHYALDREREFDTPASLAMPNRLESYLVHLEFGWDVMCELPFLVKHNCQSKQHRCCEVEMFDERFDDLFASIAARFSFIVLKDHRFINWRVALRPDKQYTRFVYEEGSDLRGYAVLKHFDDKGYRKSHILDIHAETDDILHELVAAAESFAHGRDELNIWTNPHNPYHQSFLEQGFYERESQDRLMIHFNHGEKETVAEGAWWVCLADNDVY